MSRLVLLLLTSLLVLPALMSAAESAATEAPTVRRVIWKFDDLRTGPKGNIRPNIARVVDWAATTHTPISFGIICEGLAAASPADIAWLQASSIERGGPVEFWNHGWDHGKKNDASGKAVSYEFKGSGLDAQTRSLRDAQQAMVAATGITFHAFGAPYNATDDDTTKVLDQFPELKVWMYGPDTDRTRTVLRPRLALEIKTGVVSFEAFQKAYTNPKVPYLLLQGHPPYWNDESFAAFTRIAEVLAKDGWQAITPSGYAALVAPAAKP